MMLYQVVAKSPSARSRWEYYPCWWPTEDEEEAHWWVRECLHEGCEAAILRASTIARLEQIGQDLLVRQDDTLLPDWWRMSSVEQLKALPDEGNGPQAGRNGAGAHWPWSGAPARGRDTVGGMHVPARPQPTAFADQEHERDTARWRMEQGPGGDLDADGHLWQRHPHFPQRMEVLHMWVRLREQTRRGELGGAQDGDPQASS